MALTADECKKILFKLGIKLGVSPKRITERLLSDLDKGDMKVAGITIEPLECHIRAWMASGMPDYANGKCIPLDLELNSSNSYTTIAPNKPKELYYRKPFGDNDGRPIKPLCDYTAK